MVQNYVGPHNGKDFADTRTLAFNEPTHRFSCVNVPSLFWQHNVVESRYSLLMSFLTQVISVSGNDKCFVPAASVGRAELKAR